jgi:antitoxin ParD1/3/4
MKGDVMMQEKPITVTLGDEQMEVDRLVASGDFKSPSHVVRAGIKALVRERDEADNVLRHMIRQSLDDPRPSIPARQVFEDLRARRAALMQAEGDGA